LPAYPFARDRYWPAHVDEAMAVPNPAVQAIEPLPADDNVASHQRISRHIITVLSSMLNLPPGEINVMRPMRDYGLESMTGLRLIRDLAAEFGVALRGRDVLSHDTVDALASHLLVRLREVQPGGQAAAIASMDEQDKPSEMAEVIVLHSLEQFSNGLLSVEQMQDILKEAGENEAA